MTNWIKYGLIYLSAGCAITGVWKWWENAQLSKAECLAEVRARVEEMQIAYLEGTNEPVNHLYAVASNVVTCVKIMSGNFSGGDVESGARNVFTYNDAGFKTIRIRVAPDAGSGMIIFQIKKDGANVFSLIAYPILSNGTAYAGSDYNGSVVLHPYEAYIPVGGYYDYQVRPDAPPDYGVDASGRVGPFLLWDELYYYGMCVLRHYAAKRSPDALVSDKAVLWLDGDVDDGAELARADVGWWKTNEFEGVHMEVSNRWSDVMTSSTMTGGKGFDYPLSTAASEFLSGTNLPIAELCYPSVADAANSAFGGSGNWWKKYLISTNLPFAFGCERVTNMWVYGHGKTDTVRAAAKWVTTNNLEECKRMTDRMTRTIALLPASYLTTSGVAIVYTVAEIYTNNALHLLEGSHAVDMGGTPAFLASVSKISVTTQAVGAASMFSCWLNGSYSLWSGPKTYDSSMTHFTFTAARCEDCKLRYPCEYAFASGYVARVRIYAVGGCSPVQDTKGLYAHRNDYHAEEGGSYWPRPCDRQTILHGIFSFGWEFSENVPPLKGSFAGDSDTGYYSETPSRYRLSLLVDSGPNPSTAPTFSFGASGVWFPTADLFSTAEWTWEDGDYDVSESRFGFHQQITLSFFVAVVDWKWKHLNEANPYEPDPYTPPWVTNNVVTNGI